MNLISRKVIISIAVIIVICCINAHYEIFALNLTKGQRYEKAEGSLRVMTYNINASLGTEDVEEVRAGLITEIEKHNPDILCLQELYPTISTEIQNSLDSLFGYNDSIEIKKETSRYSLYSKKPLKNFKRYKCTSILDTIGFDKNLQGEVRLIQRRMPVFSADIEIKPGIWITVFSCHLRSSAYSTARRSMGEDSSWSDGISLYLFNYKMGKKIRDYEAENFRMYLDSLEAIDTPILIAGDFNDWSGSYCLNTIRNGKYRDAWWEGGLGFGITFDEWHLKLRLDHILFSRHFELDNVYIEKSKFSDHYPLICDLSYKK